MSLGDTIQPIVDCDSGASVLFIVQNGLKVHQRSHPPTGVTEARRGGGGGELR